MIVYEAAVELKLPRAARPRRRELARFLRQAIEATGLAGVVRDATGAVLPGVTVEASSPALIEKTRTVVTDEQGQFKVIDLDHPLALEQRDGITMQRVEEIAERMLHSSASSDSSAK